MSGFYPENFKPTRKESPGEAQMRLAGWWVAIWKLFGVRYYPFEVEAAATAFGPFIRRWPRMAKWKAPPK